ncbi:MAG: hypothetical protein EOO27_34740 [Comamonadaceae bacterium]|nr:MAG: hypothetical protein EOO27_34740 [Comamonadaceae bacterium]
MIWNHAIPQPPVPQGIRDALKDYPELIREIQEGLNRSVDGMLRGAHFPPFEEAVWFFESKFDKLYANAIAEVEAAEMGGNSQAIEHAKAKRHLIGRTSGAHHWNDDGEGNLWEYFQTYKGAFE